MTYMRPVGGRIGAPIAAQLISLLAAGWIITLLVTIVVVMVLPPPQRPAYQLAEIAQALQGGPLDVREGGALMRVHQAAAPAVGQVHFTTGMDRAALAAVLHLPLSSVRLERYPEADPLRRQLLDTLQANPPRPVPTSSACSPSIPLIST